MFTLGLGILLGLLSISFMIAAALAAIGVSVAVGVWVRWRRYCRTCGDPRRRALMRYARSRWPAFIEAFEHRRPDQRFFVKTPISRDGRTERMWVMVTAIEGGRVLGELDNDSAVEPGLHMGVRVVTPENSVCDWMFTDGPGVVGGFTARRMPTPQALPAVDAGGV